MTTHTKLQPPKSEAPDDKSGERNRELQALLDAMREVVIFFDRWGLAKHGNERARRLHPSGQIKGCSFIELMPHWDDPAERQRELMQVIRCRRPIRNSRERARIESGERWFSVDKIPTTEQDGSVTGAMLVITDISEHVFRERALLDSDSRYRAFIANSSDALWRYDVCPPIDTRLPVDEQVELILRRAVLIECNERLARLYDVNHTNDLIGLPIYRNGSLSNKDDIRDFVCNGYRIEDKEFSRITRQGERIYLQSNAIGIVENGCLTRAWGTTRNITERRRYLARMEYLADHDALTSLPNRSLLYRKMEDLLANRRPFQKMALLLIDLDRFKEINDTLGHLAGDKVLKQLGPRLEVELGDTPGVVARLGGDEFAIFLSNIRNSQQAIVLSHRFLDSICLVFELEGFRTEISASIGVSIAPDQAEDVSTLMRFADVAMYHAKTNLQGVAVYNPEYDPHSPKRLELMGALGRAIREDQLTLHFQPKVKLSSHQVYGFEALIRWNHPEIGFVPPNDFVPIAEMSNLIYPMTVWVLEHSIRQCAVWLSKGYNVDIAVNLSVRNLLDDRIISDLKRILAESDFPATKLELEITESMIMSDPARALAALERISELGVRLSIDDFGTGYSSLAYLKRLPVQTLKIDYSFVRTMLDSEQDQIIVNSTINLAHNLGLSVVAEGVENEGVYRKLMELGCDSAQGYYIARPMAAEQIEQWLQGSDWSSSYSSSDPMP